MAPGIGVTRESTIWEEGDQKQGTKGTGKDCGERGWRKAKNIEIYVWE